jgi:hypothetical protein
MVEKEKTEKFGGLRFMKRHTVRSLKSANAWKKHYEGKGNHVRIEREGPARYNVYTRRK